MNLKLMTNMVLARACLAVFGFAAGHAVAQDATECVKLERIQHKPLCGGPNDIRVTYSNACTRPIEVKFCLQRMDGTANCSLYSVRPGREIGVEGCKVTGKIWYQGRVLGSNMRFLNDRDINWNQR